MNDFMPSEKQNVGLSGELKGGFNSNDVVGDRGLGI